MKINQKLNVEWQIKLVNFPPSQEIFIGDLRGCFIGLINESNVMIPNHDGRFYSIDDSGLAVHGSPFGTLDKNYGRYHNVRKWKKHLKTGDIIKIELTVIKKEKYSTTGLRFYKNNMFVLEYDGINEECEYRLFVSMNTPSTSCSIIKYECSISQDCF